MEAQPDSVRSFRELLRYILQEFQTKGGRLTLPVGCYHLEDWLLDAVYVPKLLHLLQTEREVNLVQACEGAGGSGNFIPGAPGPLAQGVISAAREPQKVQDDHRASAGPDNACDLMLPLPPTGMSEAELENLAYTLFIGCCSAYCSEELADDVRRQLQVSQASADSLQNLLGEAASMQSQAASSLEMIVMLLQIARPRHFSSFQAFAEWRQSAAAAICQSLALGAAEAASEMRHGQPPSARSELLRLKTYLRMMAVPNPEEFDEDVYAEAADAVVAAATGVANVSGLGWGLPWAVRVRIAELLMSAGFDASAEGQPVPEQQQLVYVLRHHLWPLLGLPVTLHDVLNAWAYLRQFALTGNAALLSAGREHIEAVRQQRNGGVSTRHASGKGADVDTFLDAVMAAAVDWVAGRLGNYRRNFQDAGPIPGLLDVLVSCQRCLGRASEVGKVLEGCIASSVQAEFERMLRRISSASTGVPKDADRIVEIAKGCSNILDEEVAYFSPMFGSHVRRPAEVAAIRVHDCFNSYLLPWLQTVHTLEDSNLEAIREAVGLESKLQTLLGERVSEGVDWAILERLTPLLHLWVSNQLSLLQSWYVRILAKETWQPVSQPRGCSSSAVELVKIVRESLEALFDLHLGLPDEVVTAAGAGLDNFLQRYAQQTAAEVGSPDFLLPPVPPLTRYKREVAIKAAAADGGRAPITPRQGGSAEGASMRGTPEQEQLASLPATSLIVRMNSLNYIRAQIPALADIVSSRWGAPEDEDSMWAEGLFDNTRNALARSIESLVQFVSMKVVFRELSGPFSALYKHDVSRSRIGPLLEALDEKLGSLCSIAEAELHASLARGLLQATLDALLRVLLHGGPHRWYQPSDVELIEEDLEDLRVLFHADGEGLDSEDILSMCSNVADLLTVLQLDTDILVDNLKQMRLQEKNGRMTGKQPPAYDSQILLHVLAHREDHAASKYLKKEFALPKKIDGGGALTSLATFRSQRDLKPASSGTTFGRKLSFGKFSRK